MVVIAHVSDLHLDGEPRSTDRARAVLDYLEDLPFDLAAVLVTGDIADHGKRVEYECARTLLTSRHPVLVCPGNHDERAAFREVLLAQPAGAGPVNQVLRTDGITLAVCDSSIPGRDDGFLEEGTLVWLDRVLEESPGDVPALVAFHHPPVALHIPFVDRIRQRGEDGLAAVVGRHPNVLGLLCGHAHTAAATTFAGLPLLVAPGVVSTLRLPWEQRAHPGDDIDMTHPPGVAFHVVDENGRLTTHYRFVTVGD